MIYPDRIPYAAWINSQLSVARHYGGMNFNGKIYLVEKGTGDLVHTPKPTPKPRKKKEVKQIGNNTGWMKPQDDEDWISDHEDLIDRADRLRDEMLDRQMEDREAGGPLPPYDEWRKLPPDEAARILAKHRNLDAEQEGLIAAILEHFPEENIKSNAGTKV